MIRNINMHVSGARLYPRRHVPLYEIDFLFNYYDFITSSGFSRFERGGFSYYIVRYKIIAARVLLFLDEREKRKVEVEIDNPRSAGGTLL